MIVYKKTEYLKDSDIGTLLRDKRARLGLTQDELSMLVGCSQSKIAKIENGQYINNLLFWIKVLKALDVEAGELRDWS